MQTNDELQARLLELLYDLLPDDEAAELRRRVDGDPAVAAAYAEIQRTAKLLADAARLQAPRITLPSVENPETAKRASGRDVRPASAAARAPLARAARWATALAAGVLLAVTAGGFFYQRGQVSQIAADHLRLVVTGPAKLQPRATNEYSVSTTSVTGAPLPVEVQYAIYAPDGHPLVENKLRTSADGRLVIAVPADLPLAKFARLDVLAVNAGKLERVQAELPVDSVHYVTHLALDKPLYQPGETVYYRSLTLGRFGLNTPQEMPIHFEMHDPSGAVVAGSPLDGVTQQGVGNGAFAIPEESAGGQFTLVARSLDGAFPEETKTFFIRRYRLPRLKKDLEFTRDSYTPGDKVIADFAAKRAEGGPAAQAALRITASVDGATVYQSTPQASPAGTQRIEFTLPAKIETGDGQLAVVIDDGGTRETIAKTIPINLGKVDVKFYPEGGDLATRWASRSTSRARSSTAPAMKPPRSRPATRAWACSSSRPRPTKRTA